MKEQFLRAGMLLGEEALEKLESSHVAVFGLGGVGSWSEKLSEFFRKLGLRITLAEFGIDDRDFEVMAERVLEINPKIRVMPRKELYNAENRERFFPPQGDVGYTFVADCIDLVSCKLDLIETCRARSIPIVSSMGTGNKADAQLLQITDISKTYGDALARVMRKELRARGIEHHPVVFSPEEPIQPLQVETPPPGRRSVPGSLCWVTASAGMLLCQYIILEIIKN